MNDIDYERHKREKYSDPSPYPKVKVERQNMFYAELLMDDYAGVISEFTAISQYLYHYRRTARFKCGSLFYRIPYIWL